MMTGSLCDISGTNDFVGDQKREGSIWQRSDGLPGVAELRLFSNAANSKAPIHWRAGATQDVHGIRSERVVWRYPNRPPTRRRNCVLSLLFARARTPFVGRLSIVVERLFSHSGSGWH